jgi:hypothetical protein
MHSDKNKINTRSKIISGLKKLAFDDLKVTSAIDIL